MPKLKVSVTKIKFFGSYDKLLRERQVSEVSVFGFVYVNSIFSAIRPTLKKLLVSYHLDHKKISHLGGR